MPNTENNLTHVAPRYIDAATVERHLPWQPLLQALHDAFAATDLNTPVRAHHHMHGLGLAQTPVLLSMPAWSAALGVGVKLVSVYPTNAQQGLPSIYGLYALLDGATGQPQAILDAGALTVRRTAAASALASRFLSRPDSRTLLMVGSGRLSHYLPLAHAQVRPIERVLVWGRSFDKAQASAQELRDQGFSAQAVKDLPQAAAEADIISCATLSAEPLIEGAWLRPGVHVDLVGAFTPHMREADDAVMARANAVWCDTLAGGLSEAGDIIQAIDSGALRRDSIRGELADLCRATHAPTRAPGDITVFKSVGAALEDLAAARLCFNLLQGSD